jgi:hypothetical protein
VPSVPAFAVERGIRAQTSGDVASSVPLDAILREALLRRDEFPEQL